MIFKVDDRQQTAIKSPPFDLENSKFVVIVAGEASADLHGSNLVKAMKRLKPDIPVIAQTAYAMSHDKEKALEVGCDDYISKPIKPLDLLNMMARFL